jgi:hypothetical protein
MGRIIKNKVFQKGCLTFDDLWKHVETSYLMKVWDLELVDENIFGNQCSSQMPGFNEVKLLELK